MKAKFLLVASFVLAIGMTGCSQSNDENPAPDKTDNVLLVTLPDNVKATRAIEASADETVTGIQDVTVFLLNGYLVDKVEKFSDKNLNDGYLRIEQVSSAVDHVVVIANNVGQNILNLKNLDEIKNYSFTVATQHQGTGLNNRTLMGEANVVEATASDPAPDGHVYKKAEVDLKAITTRLEIGAVVAGDGVAAVELVAVYVNNVFGTYPQKDLIFHKDNNSCWEVTAPNNLQANTGSSSSIGTLTLPAYTPVEYMNTADARVKPVADSEVYAYHVFPGNVPHIVMLVKLELLDNYYELDDTGAPLKYKYGFVTFSKFNTDSGYITELLPHNIYRVGLGANGIKINAKDVTDKPEKGPYDLSVKVDVQPWNVHIVTPEV